MIVEGDAAEARGVLGFQRFQPPCTSLPGIVQVFRRFGSKALDGTLQGLGFSLGFSTSLKAQLVEEKIP
jgi:hypothetical protein